MSIVSLKDLIKTPRPRTCTISLARDNWSVRTYNPNVSVGQDPYSSISGWRKTFAVPMIPTASWEIFWASGQPSFKAFIIGEWIYSNKLETWVPFFCYETPSNQVFIKAADPILLNT